MSNESDVSTAKTEADKKPEATAEKPAEPASVSATAAEPAAPDNKDALFDPTKMGLLNDVNIPLTIEIGRSEIKIRDLLNLSKGSIIELNKMSGEPVEVYANGKLISLGEIITVNGKYCVKLSSCTTPHPGGTK